MTVFLSCSLHRGVVSQLNQSLVMCLDQLTKSADSLSAESPCPPLCTGNLNSGPQPSACVRLTADPFLQWFLVL